MPELTPKLGIKKPLGNETVSRAAFNENWDIIDAMAQKNITQGPTAPANPTEGDLWIDTSTTPNTLKRYSGGVWVKVVGKVEPSEIGAASAADLAAHLADNAPNPRGNQIYHVEVVSSSGSETPEQGRIIFDTSQGKFLGGNGSEWV